jgi:hypothetical protein
MVRIAITQVAFDAIAKTLPLGNLSYENVINERGGAARSSPAPPSSPCRPAFLIALHFILH